MKEIKFVFFKGISNISKLIRKITGSVFSHVGYLSTKDNTLIECWQADKIRLRDLLSFHPIQNLNKKFCWKYSSFNNHEKGTPYVILSKKVPTTIFEVIDNLFRYMAEYNIPYDILGLFGRLNKNLDSKYGMYCSEGCQNVLCFTQRLYLDKYGNDLILTDINVPGYRTDPGMLYYILLSCDYKIVDEGET